MKKLLALLLAVVMVFGLVACGGETEPKDDSTVANTTEHDHDHDHDHENENEAPSAVTVETVYGSVEVPYAPERVCVLNGDMLDIMVALGLGDSVTCVRTTNEYPAYLESYYTSETIIQLNTSTKNLPEGTDPMEPYYSIDADLIIASVQEIDQEKYDVLCQIAPTVVLDYVSNHADGMYAGVKANAKAIASIWGVEATVDELTASYDELYAQLQAAAEGKTCVIAKGKADMNSIQVQANNNDPAADDEAVKDNERAGLLLNELGFINLSNETPEEVSMNATSKAVKEAGEDTEAVAAVAKSITDWIESADPDYLWVIDKSYSSLEEVQAAGFDYLYVTDLTVYAEGGFHFLAKEWTLARGGLTGMFTMLDQLAGILLN